MASAEMSRPTQRLKELQESIGSKDVLALRFEEQQLDFRHTLHTRFKISDKFGCGRALGNHAVTFFHATTHFNVVVVV